ncbi:MAG: glycosyltransferase family 4 protein, partial [Clostridia bacterium]|nr:glycosyltransferase family 4 protein [Clostridia bacterium]
MDYKEKVLLVHNYYKIPGGEDSVVANEKQMLEENGHQVVFYSRHNNEMDSMSKLQKLLLPINTIFNFKTFKDIIKIIKTEKIDIVHVHNTLTLISPAVYYAALYCKVPVVQTVHNFRMICPGATFYRDGNICEDCVSKGLKCAIKHKCYRGSLLQTLLCVLNTKIHRFTGIYKKINYICLTEFNKEKLLLLNKGKRKVIDETKVFIKPNFSPIETTEEIKTERKDQYVFVGRLEEIKGIKLLLEAWKQLGESAPKLILCGTGPLEDWCKDFVEENKLNNVEFRGFIPNEDVIDIISESRALIFPTQVYEGFPMTIAEAFSVGTPVICSDLGNAGSIVEEGITGLKFQIDSVEGLLEAVNRLDGYESIYETSKKEFAEKYTKQKNYLDMCAIYEGIKMIKVAIVTNIPSPYRVDLYNYLHENVTQYDFNIIYTSENESNRAWVVNEEKLVKSYILTYCTNIYLKFKIIYIENNRSPFLSDSTVYFYTSGFQLNPLSVN